MIARGVLPFQYQSEEGGRTVLAGLPAYLDLF